MKRRTFSCPPLIKALSQNENEILIFQSVRKEAQVSIDNAHKKIKFLLTLRHFLATYSIGKDGAKRNVAYEIERLLLDIRVSNN